MCGGRRTRSCASRVCAETHQTSVTAGLAGTKVRELVPSVWRLVGQRGDTPQPGLARNSDVLHTPAIPTCNSHLQSSQTTAAQPLLPGPGLCLQCPSHPSSTNHTISLNPSTFYMDRGHILRDTNPGMNRHQLHFIWGDHSWCSSAPFLTELCHTEGESHGGFPQTPRVPLPEQSKSKLGHSQANNKHTHLLNDFCFVNESGAMSLITTAWE